MKKNHMHDILFQANWITRVGELLAKQIKTVDKIKELKDYEKVLQFLTFICPKMNECIPIK
jgi:hypothetical protein